MKPPSRRSARIVPGIALVFLLLVLTFWGVVRFGADEAALPTLFVFGPRWLLAFPFVLLVPLVVWARSRWGIAFTLVAGVVVAGPLAGGRVSIGPVFGGERRTLAQIRILTWNTQGKTGPSFRRFVEQTDPELLVCQESGLAGAELPKGWTIVPEAPSVASRLPIRADGSLNFYVEGLGGRLDRFILDTPDGEIILINVHLPTVRPGLEAFIGTKGRNLTELRLIIRARDEASRKARSWVGNATNMILVGDFNMPVESCIYRRDWSGFRNAFDEAGNGWGTTKHTRWHGVRIDHVLYTSQWRCRKVWVGPALGSDHSPVVADLAWEDG
jgi:vancomycin resistance protein VanJ